MMNSVSSQSIWGIAANQKLFAESAQKLSPKGGSSGSVISDQDMVQGAVGLLQARGGIQANLAVIQASDEMLGSLIDTFA